MPEIKQKKVLMVLAPENFRDEEFFKVRAQLGSAGVNVVPTSLPKTEEAKGTLGGHVKIELSLDKINLDDFDGLVFVGGTGSKIYFKNPLALSLVKQAQEKDKVIGAICIASTILANAGILKGKKVTASVSEEANLKSQGAIFTGDSVTIDGKIVTGSGPKASEEFGKALAKVLS